MRPFLLFAFLISLTTLAQAQKVDSIYFHLYTDSLKKGTHNYINVDGKLSDGRWLPLTAKELIFTSTGGRFDGNSLFIDSSFKDPKVNVRVALKNNPSIFKDITIFVKTTNTDEKLKSVDELMEEWKKKSKDREKDKKKKNKESLVVKD